MRKKQGIVYVPFLQKIFNATVLPPEGLVLCLIPSTLLFWLRS